METNILELIKKRRSVRRFKQQEVPLEIIKKSLESARWAPSGLNNQPWKFMVLAEKEKDALAKYTKYDQVVREANKLILVFLDKDSSYNYQKDLMAIGAAIQNILIYLTNQNIGSCWLGEIMNQNDKVEKELETSQCLEFVAAVAVGILAGKAKTKERKPLKDLILT
ncbi:MAG: nitroreductase family protein [Candidatus Omnitrophica bacterium]|nr:nitroreductase family protein [Candidatus Omnitrophota bacterium]